MAPAENAKKRLGKTSLLRQVLVVEDDRGLNRLVQKALQRAGFEVEGVLSGADAITRIRANPALFLLLDQKLPDMSGTDLIRKLRNQGSAVPFIAMTGHGDEHTAVEMMKLGARDYLVKSMDLPDMLPQVFARVFKELESEHRLARAEQALRESEERYRRIFENSVVGIFQSIPEGRFISVNPAFARILGYESPQELVEGISDIATQYYVNPDDRRRFEEVLWEQGYVENMEFQVQRRDGSHIWVSNSTRTCFDPERILTYYEGIVVDISERKQAEAEKVRLEEQIRQAQKLESVGRLAGGVAHDLNNLLSPILGYSEMLLEDSEDGDPCKEPLEEIVNAGSRARNLVRQLLAFSRKQTLEFEPIDLNWLLENFQKLLRRTVREDIAIHLNLERALPFIQGDIGQLEQVVMNLAVNGQDAMPDGGSLTIQTGAVRLGQADTARHQGLAPGNYVMLQVKDTGCGMDARTLENLFEPFFTTKPQGKGTGLGLATVYGIVKQHGGDIWVKSRPGQGALFKVYLPVSEQSRQTEEEKKLRPQKAGGFETILLVEDNPQVRNLTRTILKREGYTVLVAECGREALAILDGHRGPLDLLLTDVVMPEMNGRQLLEQVWKPYPGLKALFMSGHSDEVIAHRGVKEPGLHFIQKPFSVKALAAKVREVLNERAEEK